MLSYNAIPSTILYSISPEYNFSDCLPYLTYENNIYTLTGNRKGFMFEISPLPVASDTVAEDIESIISDILPEHSTFQSHVYTSNRYDFVFKIAKNLIKTYSDSTVSPDVYREIEDYQFNKFQEVKMRRWRYFISVSCPGKSDIIKAYRSVNQILKGAGLSPVTVIPHRLISLLSEIFGNSNNQRKIVYDPHCYIKDQVILSDSVVLREGWGLNPKYQVGGKYVVGLRVHTYPDEVRLPVMNYLLGHPDDVYKQINFPFLITLNTQIPNREFIATKVTGKATTSISQSYGASLSPYIVKRISSFRNMKWALGNRHTPVGLYLHFILFVDDRNEIPSAVENMKGIGRYLGFKLKSDGVTTLPAFLSDLPMNLSNDMKSIGYIETTHSQIASNMVLIQGDSNGGRIPTIVLTTQRNDISPLCFFQTDGNKNVTLTGKSGSGKSVYLATMLINYAKRGAKIYGFDKGFSLGPIAQIHGGDIIRCDNKKKLSFNPFTYLDDIENEVDFIWPIFGQMINPNGALAQAYIEIIKEKIIDEHAIKGRNGSVQGVFDRLNNSEIGRQLTPSMKSWVTDNVKGNYVKYVEGDATVDFRKQFTLLEIQEFDKIDSLKAVIIPLYLFQVYKNCFYGELSRIKIIPMDEAHAYFYGESITKFMDTFIREIRKYNGMIITATQHQRDYFHHPSVVTVYDNSEHHIFMKQDAQLGPYFPGLNKYEIEIINNLKTTPAFSELYIKSPIISGVYRLRLSEYMLWMAMTSPAVRDIRDKKLMEFNGDIDKTIKHLMKINAMPSSGIGEDVFY